MEKKIQKELGHTVNHKLIVSQPHHIVVKKQSLLKDSVNECQRDTKGSTWQLAASTVCVTTPFQET